MSSKSKRGPIAVLGLVACLAAGQVSAASVAQARTKEVRPSSPSPAHHVDMFSRLDTDRNGTIGRAEWDAAAQRHHRHDPTHSFKRLDTNGDGAIVQSEWSAHHDRAKVARADRRQHHKAHANQHDRFAHQERSAKRSNQQRSRPSPARVFAMLDTDSNGTLSRHEWEQGRDRLHARRR